MAWLLVWTALGVWIVPEADAQQPGLQIEPFDDGESSADLPDTGDDPAPPIGLDPTLDEGSLEGDADSGETQDNRAVQDNGSAHNNGAEEVGPSELAEELVTPGMVLTGQGMEDEYYDEEMATSLAPVFSSGEWLDTGCWYTRADFLLIARSSPRPKTFSVDVSTFTINEGQPDEFFIRAPRNGPLSTKDHGFRIGPGLKLTTARYLGTDHQNRDHTLEVMVMLGLDWDTAQTTRSSEPEFLITPLDGPQALAGFNGADTSTYAHSSDLNSFELNYRKRRRLGRDQMVHTPDGRWIKQMTEGSTPSLFFGMRYMRTTEKLLWVSLRQDVAFEDFGGRYDVETENNLIGLHFGSDWTWQKSNWDFGMRSKFGAFVNLASQDSVITANDTVSTDPKITGTIERHASDQAASFVGEMGWWASYHFNNCWSFRTSYDFMWVQGIADATRQIDFNRVALPSVNLSGNQFYQGFSLGFEFLW